MSENTKFIPKNLLIPVTLFFMFITTTQAIATPGVEWIAKDLDVEQMLGTQSIHTLTVKTNKNVQDIAVRVGPKLQPWVTVSPASIQKLQRGQDIEVSIVINVPPSAKVGTYNGVIQLRIANDGQQQKTLAKPLPIKILITEKMEGELPPDPKKAGKRTLLGIDSDNDGVRDDIQRYIYFTYPDEEKVRSALTQVALQWQGLLSQANDPEAAYFHTTKMMRHGECLDYMKGRIAGKMIAALDAEVLNTRERSIAYINHSKSLGGAMISGAPLKEWKNSCAFDVDAMGENQ
jgi:hypothetical protein